MKNYLKYAFTFGIIKKAVVLIFLFSNYSFGQWEYWTSSYRDMPIAEGKILSDTEYDFKFMLFKHNLMGLAFSVNSDYFQKDQDYSITFKLDNEGTYELTNYIVNDGNVDMMGFKINGEEKSINDLLDVFKSSLGCIVKIYWKDEGQRLEMFSYMSGYDSKNAINHVLKN